jgi:hypothetical protein
MFSHVKYSIQTPNVSYQQLLPSSDKSGVGYENDALRTAATYPVIAITSLCHSATNIIDLHKDR